jgi:hypothetical protein
LEEEKQRFDTALKKNLDDISWLEQKRENAEKAFQEKLVQQDTALQIDKEKQLRTIDELINERRGRVDVEVDTYRTCEM